jgi:hypothetical protein
VECLRLHLNPGSTIEIYQNLSTQQGSLIDIYVFRDNSLSIDGKPGLQGPQAMIPSQPLEWYAPTIKPDVVGVVLFIMPVLPLVVADPVGATIQEDEFTIPYIQSMSVAIEPKSCWLCSLGHDQFFAFGIRPPQFSVGLLQLMPSGRCNTRGKMGHELIESSFSSPAASRF